MKAGLYLRVSTTEQTTLKQKLELEKYCKNNNIEIFKIYIDEGISGSNISTTIRFNVARYEKQII